MVSDSIEFLGGVGVVHIGELESIRKILLGAFNFWWRARSDLVLWERISSFSGGVW